MNQKNIAREAIAKYISAYTVGIRNWAKAGPSIKREYLKEADAILNLRDAEGKQLIGVISKDQEPPMLPLECTFGLIRTRYYIQGQKDMLAAGFVRIE